MCVIVFKVSIPTARSFSYQTVHQPLTGYFFHHWHIWSLPQTGPDAGAQVIKYPWCWSLQLVGGGSERIHRG